MVSPITATITLWEPKCRFGVASIDGFPDWGLFSFSADAIGVQAGEQKALEGLTIIVKEISFPERLIRLASFKV